jgi:hypothetical protein
MELMKSWVDTCLNKDNIWLVLVFHGVEGIGWEAKSRDEFVEYFDYLNRHREEIWIAAFRDVTKYIRERMSARVAETREGDVITVKLTHNLDREMYDFPLTLKTYIPADWNGIQGFQNGKIIGIQRLSDDHGEYVQYEAVPNAGNIRLLPGME